MKTKLTQLKPESVCGCKKCSEKQNKLHAFLLWGHTIFSANITNYICVYMCLYTRYFVFRPQGVPVITSTTSQSHDA